MDKPPNLVIFDLDNTLYEYMPCHKAGLIAASKLAQREYGIPKESFLQEYKIARTRVKSRVKGASSHNRLLYLKEMIDATQLRLDLDAPMNLNDAYWSAYFLRMHLAEGYETLIHKFRHKAITIALVTDQIAELQLKKIRILEIEKHFDYIVTSEECSGEKITLAPFELLISRIRSENLDCTWFIGDEKQDWPTALNLNKKVYFASPFSGRAPKYVRKIYSYKDLANEV